MGSPAKKKVRFVEDEDDKFSKLPDELVHKVLSFLDAKVAVQTSVLSKRWKLIWTTLPFLNFDWYENSSSENTYGFIRHVLSNRNHQSLVFEFSLCTSRDQPPENLVENFVEYAIQHNVEHLNLKLLCPHIPYKLSTLSSNSIKKLTLEMKLEEFVRESDCWNLPALTYLRLRPPLFVSLVSLTDLYDSLPESCLTCLPALRTLCLDYWDLSTSSFSFSLPCLITLRLFRCYRLPQKVWNFPALLSLELDYVDFPKNMNEIFPTLVNLQNLTLFLTRPSLEQHHTISCPQLLKLNIRIYYFDSLYGDIKVLAPKLRNFTSVGILSITFEVPELENVNIMLHGWFGYMDWMYRKKYYRLFTDMLSGLGNAKNLTFDLDSIEALSATDFLASLPSPFFNLKTVKLPVGYKKSRLSGALRSYLRARSPRATIITTLPQNNVNLVVNTNMVRQVAAPIEGTSNDQASSSTENSGFGLWQGHEVHSEFVGLLDLIMTKYPETFEHFTAKSERFYTVMLNMLCTLINEFLRTSMTELNIDIITDYRDQFADLQRWGFNVNWLVSHLNSIEQLGFSQHDSGMDDARNKLQDLQTQFLEKISGDLESSSASP